MSGVARVRFDPQWGRDKVLTVFLILSRTTCFLTRLLAWMLDM